MTSGAAFKRLDLFSQGEMGAGRTTNDQSKATVLILGLEHPIDFGDQVLEVKRL